MNLFPCLQSITNEGYTFPLTITLSAGHTGSAAQGIGANVSFPILGSLLKTTKTISSSFADRTGLVTGQCLLLDSDGNTVISLNNGTNDVTAYTDAQWDSIVTLQLASGGYTSGNSMNVVGTVTFSDT